MGYSIYTSVWLYITIETFHYICVGENQWWEVCDDHGDEDDDEDMMVIYNVHERSKCMVHLSRFDWVIWLGRKRFDLVIWLGRKRFDWAISLEVHGWVNRQNRIDFNIENKATELGNGMECWAHGNVVRLNRSCQWPLFLLPPNRPPIGAINHRHRQSNERDQKMNDNRNKTEHVVFGLEGVWEMVT